MYTVQLAAFLLEVIAWGYANCLIRDARLSFQALYALSFEVEKESA